MTLLLYHQYNSWPVVFSRLGGGAHWVRLLFFTLFLLGIDSAFSMIEGLLTCLKDTTYLKDVPRWNIAAVVCIFSYLLSFSIYCTDIGYVLLWTIITFH